MAVSYKSSISFGLVYLPIELHATTKSGDIGFHMLDKNTMSRIKYQKTCVDCDGKLVDGKDIIKGYEYEKDRYVVFTDAELEKIKSKRDKTIEIKSFVPKNSVNPLYYEKTYYVVPKGAEKAYHLLAEAMGRSQKVAIATSVLGSRENLIAIREEDGQLLLSTLYYFDEVQVSPVKSKSVKVNKTEIELAEKLIESMTGEFQPQKYKDNYREKVKKAIEQKVAGLPIETEEEVPQVQVASLMDALAKSLAMLQQGARSK